MKLENRLNGCQDLAVIQENLMVNGLLGRTIFSSKHLICQHIMCNRLGVCNKYDIENEAADITGNT